MGISQSHKIALKTKKQKKNWTSTGIYLILCIISNSTYARCFQCKILSYTLFLYKKLYIFKSHHYDLSLRKRRWNCIPSLFLLSESERPQESFKTLSCGEFDAFILIPAGCCLTFNGKFNMENVVLCNHLFLTFKLYIYRCQKKGFSVFLTFQNRSYR